MLVTKRCNCCNLEHKINITANHGLTYSDKLTLLKDGKIISGMIWFNCSCNSTLVIKVSHDK